MDSPVNRGTGITEYPRLYSGIETFSKNRKTPPVTAQVALKRNSKTIRRYRAWIVADNTVV